MPIVIPEGMGLEDWSVSDLGSFWKKLKKHSPGRLIARAHRRFNPIHKLIRPKRKKHAAATYAASDQAATASPDVGPGAPVDTSEVPGGALAPASPYAYGGGGGGGGRASLPAEVDPYADDSSDGGDDGGDGEEGEQAPAADTGPKKSPLTKPVPVPPTVAPTQTGGLPDWVIWGGGIAAVVGVIWYAKKKRMI